jgi:hypothetical protein
VLRCVDHTGEEAVVKELALIKVGADAVARAEVLQIASISAQDGGPDRDLDDPPWHRQLARRSTP